MSLCAACGLGLIGDDELCPHHHRHYVDDEWAQSNRILCDFFHRAKVPARVPLTERELTEMIA